ADQRVVASRESLGEQRLVVLDELGARIDALHPSLDQLALDPAARVEQHDDARARFARACDPWRALGCGHPQRRSLRGPDVHGYPLDHVVGVALEVPGRLERLDVAGGVGRARADHVPARYRAPVEPPPAPRALAERPVERGLAPIRSAGGTALGP